jgi:hypothetical protein
MEPAQSDALLALFQSVKGGDRKTCDLGELTE